MKPAQLELHHNVLALLVSGLRFDLGQYDGRHVKLREADQDFAKAVTLAKPWADYSCRRAAFVERMLNDRKRVYELQKMHCPLTPGPVAEHPSCDSRLAVRRDVTRSGSSPQP